MSDYKVFKEKSLADIFEDIYNNSADNKKQLDVLIREVVQFIKDGDTAVQLIPAIKEYLDIKVKNDIAFINNDIVFTKNIHLKCSTITFALNSEADYCASISEKNKKIFLTINNNSIIIPEKLSHLIENILSVYIISKYFKIYEKSSVKGKSFIIIDNLIK